MYEDWVWEITHPFQLSIRPMSVMINYDYFIVD